MLLDEFIQLISDEENKVIVSEAYFAAGTINIVADLVVDGQVHSRWCGITSTSERELPDDDELSKLEFFKCGVATVISTMRPKDDGINILHAIDTNFPLTISTDPHFDVVIIEIPDGRRFILNPHYLGELLREG